MLLQSCSAVSALCYSAKVVLLYEFYAMSRCLTTFKSQAMSRQQLYLSPDTLPTSLQLLNARVVLMPCVLSGSSWKTIYQAAHKHRACSSALPA